MAYAAQTWINGDTENSPLSASRLNHLEGGVSDAHDALDGLGISDVDGLQSALNAKANASALTAKADAADLSDLVDRVAALEAAAAEPDE